MANDTTKSKATKRKKPVRRKKACPYVKPYEAKKFAGTVPAFAHVTLEEMRTWRDDR